MSCKACKQPIGVEASPLTNPIYYSKETKPFIKNKAYSEEVTFTIFSEGEHTFSLYLYTDLATIQETNSIIQTTDVNNMLNKIVMYVDGVVVKDHSEKAIDDTYSNGHEHRVNTFSVIQVSTLVDLTVGEHTFTIEVTPYEFNTKHSNNIIRTYNYVTDWFYKDPLKQLNNSCITLKNYADVGLINLNKPYQEVIHNSIIVPLVNLPEDSYGEVPNKTSLEFKTGLVGDFEIVVNLCLSPIDWSKELITPTNIRYLEVNEDSRYYTDAGSNYYYAKPTIIYPLYNEATHSYIYNLTDNSLLTINIKDNFNVKGVTVQGIYGYIYSTFIYLKPI